MYQKKPLFYGFELIQWERKDKTRLNWMGKVKSEPQNENKNSATKNLINIRAH